MLIWKPSKQIVVGPLQSFETSATNHNPAKFMNENLQAIKAGLDKVEAIQKRREQFEAERTELTAKIETLTTSAAAGSAQAATSLTISKARLESALPADLKRCESEFDAEVNGLRTQIETLRYPIGQANSAEYNRMTGVVRKFLEQYLSGKHAHFIEDTTRQIVLKCKTVVELESLVSIYGNPQLIHAGKPENIIWRAKQAIEALSNVI